MSLRDDAVALRELLGVETRWTKEAYARDRFGLSTQPGSPSARCWCLDGGVLKVCGPEEEDGPVAALSGAINRVLVDVGYSENERVLGARTAWNDARARTHAEVVELLDLLVEACR